MMARHHYCICFYFVDVFYTFKIEPYLFFLCNLLGIKITHVA
jgi:hypothetical protein